MKILILIAIGLAGGVIGGMGMGGGTALIPLLTLFGVHQAAAQGIILLSFLPMAALALSIHAKNGLVKRDGLLFFVLPALLFSVPGALLATCLPSAALERAFGAFLIVLSLFRFRGAFAGRRSLRTRN